MTGAAVTLVAFRTVQERNAWFSLLQKTISEEKEKEHPKVITVPVHWKSYKSNEVVLYSSSSPFDDCLSLDEEASNPQVRIGTTAIESCFGGV